MTPSKKRVDLRLTIPEAEQLAVLATAVPLLCVVSGALRIRWAESALAKLRHATLLQYSRGQLEEIEALIDEMLKGAEEAQS